MADLNPNDFVTLSVGECLLHDHRTHPHIVSGLDAIGAMFSGRIEAKRKELKDHYLIDRDGELFRYVLNFLRNRALGIPEDFKQLQMLLLEAEFYQIEPMCEAIRELLQKLDPEPIMQVIEVEVRSFHGTSQWDASHWANTRGNRVQHGETMRWTVHGPNATLRQVPCLVNIIDSTQDSSGHTIHDFLRLKFMEKVDREAHTPEQFNRSKLFQEIGRVGFSLKATETHWPIRADNSVQWQRWVFTRG